jgi:hypothetical protein
MVSVNTCRDTNCDNLKFMPTGSREPVFVCGVTGLMPRYMDTCVVEEML